MGDGEVTAKGAHGREKRGSCPRKGTEKGGGMIGDVLFVVGTVAGFNGDSLELGPAKLFQRVVPHGVREACGGIRPRR